MTGDTTTRETDTLSRLSTMPSGVRNPASMHGMSRAAACWQASITRNTVRLFKSARPAM